MSSVDPDEIERRIATTPFRTRALVMQYAVRWLEYFNTLRAKQPDYDHWQRGACMTERWIRMLHGDAPSQEELDVLLADMRAETTPGSAYCDLYRRIQDWAAAFDLRVSEDNDFPSHW